MHSFPHKLATSSCFACSSFPLMVITHSEFGDFRPSSVSVSSLIVIFRGSYCCWRSSWLWGVFSSNLIGWVDVGLCKFGIPASTVSLSLRVMRYQLNSSLLNTATISVEI